MIEGDFNDLQVVIFSCRSVAIENIFNESHQFCEIMKTRVTLYTCTCNNYGYNMRGQLFANQTNCDISTRVLIGVIQIIVVNKISSYEPI